MSNYQFGKQDWESVIGHQNAFLKPQFGQQTSCAEFGELSCTNADAIRAGRWRDGRVDVIRTMVTIR